MIQVSLYLPAHPPERKCKEKQGQRKGQNQESAMNQIHVKSMLPLKKMLWIRQQLNNSLKQKKFSESHSLKTFRFEVTYEEEK